MVKSWILNSVTKPIYGSILRFIDASEIWKDLMARFHLTNLPRSYQLTQQIWSLQQGSSDLSSYYTKLKTLWGDLDGADCVKTCHTCACCKAMATKTKHTKVIKFLDGLNDSYSNARSQIIMKKHVPDLSEVYNLLDQDFNQHSISPLQNASAFQVASHDTIPASINATYNSKPPRPVCSHCGYNGHTIDKCYKIHGYPPGFKHKKNPNDKYSPTDKQSNNVKPVVAQLAINDSKQIDDTVLNTLSKDQIQSVIEYFNNHLQSSQANHASTSTGTITALPSMAFSSSTIGFVGILRATGNVLSFASWIIDSGATHHVSHDKDLFESLSDSLNRSVTLPTGQNINIKRIGQIRLNEYLLLTNVLYIPDFRLNLLSISQLTKDLGCRVMFDQNSCLIQDW